MSRASKLERAEKVLADFQLEGCADTPVGDPVGRRSVQDCGSRVFKILVFKGFPEIMAMGK